MSGNDEANWRDAWRHMELGERKEALSRFIMSAQAGYTDAKTALAYFVDTGEFNREEVPPDIWQSIANEKEDPTLLWNRGLDEVEQGNLADAFQLMLNSYLHGEPDALVFIVELFPHSHLEPGALRFFTGKLQEACKRGMLSDYAYTRALHLKDMTD